MFDDTSQPLNGLSILVVEDDLDRAESEAVLLRFAGHEVEIARDAVTARESAEVRPPDVVLLDLWLPKIDGYALAKWLRNQDGKAPFIIAVTGSAEDRRRDDETGIDLHLTRPVDPSYLLALLERFNDIVR